MRNLRVKIAELQRTVKVFFNLLGHMRKHRARIAFLVGCVLLGSGFASIAPLLGKLMVDRILPDRNWSLFWLVTIGYCAASVLMSAKGLYQGYISLHVQQSVRASLAIRFFKSYLRLPYLRTQEKGPGAQIYRITSDVDAVVGLITGFFTSIVANMCSLVVSISIMLKLQWKMTIVFLAVLPALFLLRLYISLRIRPLQKTIREGNEDISSFLGEVFSRVACIKIWGAENHETKRYVTLLRHNIRLNFKLWAMSNLFSLIQGLCESSVGTLLQWIIWIKVMSGYTTLGSAMALTWYFGMIVGPIMALAGSIQSVIAGMVPGERVSEILNGKKERLGGEKPIPHDREGYTLRFHHVSFEYPGGNRALENVSFTLSPGTITALVGPSGAGKSTILNLICGLYLPTQGRIEVNGAPIHSISIGRLRALMSYVPQESSVFGSSIEDNIRYSSSQATAAEVVEAARLACIHERIMQMADEYRTKLGERSSGLSAGERQRVGIARAFLRGSPILVLDEAFCHLDVDAERHIMGSIEKLKEERTIVIVSHRLPCLMVADQIIIVENGRVVETGSPAELMEKNGPLKQWLTASEGPKPLLSEVY